MKRAGSFLPNDRKPPPRIESDLNQVTNDLWKLEEAIMSENATDVSQLLLDPALVIDHTFDPVAILKHARPRNPFGYSYSHEKQAVLAALIQSHKVDISKNQFALLWFACECASRNWMGHDQEAFAFGLLAQQHPKWDSVAAFASPFAPPIFAFLASLPQLNFNEAVLFGSRAAQKLCVSGFRDVRYSDWDLIISPELLIRYLFNRKTSVVPDLKWITSPEASVAQIRLGQVEVFVPTTSQSSHASILKYVLHYPTITDTVEGIPVKVAPIHLLVAFKRAQLFYPKKWKANYDDYRVLKQANQDPPDISDLEAQIWEETVAIRGPSTVDGESTKATATYPKTITKDHFFGLSHEQQLDWVASNIPLKTFGAKELAVQDMIHNGPSRWISDFILENYDEVVLHPTLMVPDVPVTHLDLFLFPSLPLETHALIFSFAIQMIPSWKSVCSSWNNTLSSPHFWRKIYENYQFNSPQADFPSDIDYFQLFGAHIDLQSRPIFDEDMDSFREQLMQTAQIRPFLSRTMINATIENLEKLNLVKISAPRSPALSQLIGTICVHKVRAFNGEIGAEHKDEFGAEGDRFRRAQVVYFTAISPKTEEILSYCFRYRVGLYDGIYLQTSILHV